MRIGLIGWYGHRNAGDERILACLRRFFAGHELVVATSYADAAGRRQELDSCDWVLLGGGGLVLRGTGCYASLVRDLRPRFGCVGLGVETRHRDNNRLIEAIKDRSEFILVRDEESRQLLDCSSKTLVGPDLTFLYPYDVAPEAQADVCGLNLRPWRSWRGEYNGLRDRLMGELSQRYPGLVSSLLFSRWRPDGAVALVRREFGEVVALPLCFETGGADDRCALSAHFDEVPDSFVDQAIDRCGFVASMRFHGLVFACQKGLPFLSFSYQPKNERFCKALGMSRFSVSLFDLSPVPRAVHEMKEERTALRATLLRVRTEYHQELSDIMTDIRRVMMDAVG